VHAQPFDDRPGLDKLVVSVNHINLEEKH